MSTATLHNEKKKNSVPELRFFGFDKNWEDLKFGKLYSFKTTNSLSRDKLNYEEGKVYNIHYGDIHTKFQSHFYLRNENVPYINGDVDLSKIKEELYCKTGDVVIADASEDYADIGKSIELIDIDNVKILAGLHTLLARPISEKIYVGFTSYLLKSWTLRKQIMTIAQGSKVLSLSTGRVSNLELNIPTLQEQQKIAAFLSSVDEKIQQLSRKKELLSEYKKGVMQQLFSGKLRFKDENGKDYADWEEKKLGEIARITTGSSNRQDSNLDGDYTFFDRSQDIRSSNIFLFDTEAIIVPGEGQEFIPKYFIGKFDLHQRTYAVMDFGVNMGKFLFFYIGYHSNHLNSHAVGSTVKSLRLPMFEKMPIKLPSIPEQQKIANFLSNIDTKIESTNQQINQTQSFKKGLLQQLFV
nr:restriction endonuclease subunit S [uncultured Flavobacterium sp.]